MILQEDKVPLRYPSGVIMETIRMRNILGISPSPLRGSSRTGHCECQGKERTPALVVQVQVSKPRRTTLPADAAQFKMTWMSLVGTK
jgi:hypothetical protein